MESSFLFSVVTLVLSPHDSLLIIQGLLYVFPLLLFIHLLGQEVSHLLLLIPRSLVSLLICHPFSHLFLHLVLLYLVIFILLSLIHLLYHSVSHLVHEVLGSSLSSLHLVQPILLLLVKHLGILLLSLHIFQSIPLPIFLGLRLRFLILFEHLLQVLFFLSSLILKHLSFHIHLILESFHHLYFLLELVLLFILLSHFFLVKLLVSGHLFILDLPSLLL